MNKIIAMLLMLLSTALFAGTGEGLNLNITHSGVGYLCLGLFVVSYLLVMTEEFIHLRKSKSVVLVAGIIWALIAWVANGRGLGEETTATFRHYLLEYAELFLFLLVAMTYVNAMEERGVFDVLRGYLVRKGFSLRQLFWITGWLAFFISPIADNLTTALVMCAVVMALGKGFDRFVAIGCINIVVAANAGGAFSPFGDITTLMVWQKGHVTFMEFFDIFVPSVINYIVPAACMHFAIPQASPPPLTDNPTLKSGALWVLSFFLLTIGTTVALHNAFHLPPVLGMMTGLGYLKFFSYYLKLKDLRAQKLNPEHMFQSFDIFQKIGRAEWDTLLFFYGIILCVGGLATLGYLSGIAQTLYHDLGQSLPAAHHATPANVIVGILSAIIDNIPVMFAVLTMHPDMSHGQWLLVTLTAGVGGSMLSIGSAAGVALMGQARGVYTFFSHLRWTPAIALGYVLSIAAHLVINQHLF